MIKGPSFPQRNMYASVERMKNTLATVDEITLRSANVTETNIVRYMISDWDDERTVPWNDFLADVEQAEEVYSETMNKERVGEPRLAYDIFLPLVTSEELTSILRMADELPRRNPCSAKAERANRRSLDKAARDCLRSSSLEEAKKQAEILRVAHEEVEYVDCVTLSRIQARMLENHPFGRPELRTSRVCPAPDQSGWSFDLSHNNVIVQERRVVLNSLYRQFGIARGKKTAAMEAQYRPLAQFYDFYQPEQGSRLIMHHGLNGPALPDAPIAFEELSILTT